MLTAVHCTARELWRQEISADDTLYAEEIRTAAARYRIDPQLVRAVICQESRFKASAIGSKGEVGLMQVMPDSAAAEWARKHKMKRPSSAELMDVELNLEIGVWYLAKALKRWQEYKDNVPLALIQYNAGESRAEKWKPADKNGEAAPGIKISSTRTYVTQIMDRYSRYIKNTK